MFLFRYAKNVWCASTEDDRSGGGNVLIEKHTDFTHVSSLLMFHKRVFKLMKLIQIRMRHFFLLFFSVWLFPSVHNKSVDDPKRNISVNQKLISEIKLDLMIKAAISSFRPQFRAFGHWIRTGGNMQLLSSFLIKRTR